MRRATKRRSRSVLCASCQHRKDGCWIAEGEDCVRHLPRDHTNLIHIDGTVITPPNVDAGVFTQQLINWVESLGYYFSGGISPEDTES